MHSQCPHLLEIEGNHLMYKETTLVLGSDPAALPVSAEPLQSEAAHMSSLLDVIYSVSYLKLYCVFSHNTSVIVSLPKPGSTKTYWSSHIGIGQVAIRKLWVESQRWGFWGFSSLPPSTSCFHVFWHEFPCFSLGVRLDHKLWPVPHYLCVDDASLKVFRARLNGALGSL